MIINTAKLEGAKARIEEEVARVKPLLTDQSIDLERRWELYEYLAKNGFLVKEDGFGTGYVNLLDCSSLYDDFYIDRYQSVSFIDMYNDRIQERLEDEELTQEQVDAWREAVLASGYSSFTYDW